MTYIHFFRKPFFLAIGFCMLLFACQNDPKVPETVQNTDPDTIQYRAVSAEGADTFLIKEGSVHWFGKKSLGDGHQGTIKVVGGMLLVNNGAIAHGTARIDMGSIAVEDIKDAGERNDLESHLKSEDFFGVQKFPEAVFTIGEVLPSNNAAFNWLVVGVLNMKGKSNPVNIPVKMEVNGDKLVANSPTFPINRTQWDVNFRSGILGTAKDKLIDDNILLSLELEARKK